MDEKLGFKFWLGFAGVCIAGAIGMFILFMFLTKAIYAWGILGLFLAVALGGLLAGWIVDKRDERRRREYEALG